MVAEVERRDQYSSYEHIEEIQDSELDHHAGLTLIRRDDRKVPSLDKQDFCIM
jgi:hypothetical protein